MNYRNGDTWLSVKVFLAYLALAGSVPILSSVRSLNNHGINVHQNFELAWGLMNIAPALIGLAVAIWHVQNLPVFSGAAAVCLTLEILFPLLDYRRVGFDQRMEVGLTFPQYLVGMVTLAIPFLGIFLVLKHRSRETNHLY